MWGRTKTYATDDPPAPPALADEIPRARGHFSGDEMSGFASNVPFLPWLLVPGGFGVAALVLAAERLLHEAGAVLQEVGADLAAGA